MTTVITADDLEYDLTVTAARVSTLPLDLEICAALHSLRVRGFIRAANRLEKASKDILHPKSQDDASKSAPAKRISVNKIQTASGKTLKLKRALSVDAYRIEESL